MIGSDSALEFKAIDWNIHKSTKKGLYISFITNVDGWKKSVVFYKDTIDQKAFKILVKLVLEADNINEWVFSITVDGRYMNSLYASQIFWIKDQFGNFVYEKPIF